MSMGNSIQEQLLKAGLVSEEQLKNANKPPRPARPKGQGKRRKRAKGAERAPLRQNMTPAKATPTLEELNAKIRGLLEAHRQNLDDADVPYNFARDNRIKKLYVSEEQRQQLLSGELAIAGYRRVHHIHPKHIADEIQTMREEIFVHRATDEAETPAGADTPPADDEHAVPDDLVW